MANFFEFHFGNRAQPQPTHFKNWESRPQWKQVHGVAVVEVKDSSQNCGEVDALWTTQKNLPIAVVTADCVPILLSRLDGRAVGAIHAGWRGTFSRIAQQFFKAMPPEFANPAEWRAQLGPAIHACCYEVSVELIDQFNVEFPSLAGKGLEPTPRHLDLIAVNRNQLQEVGVEIVDAHPDCTGCSKAGDELRYFSYRRGDRKSRMYSAIVLTD